MKQFSIPEQISAFIFDIDNTLYTNEAYAFEQVDVQVRHFAELRGITADEARLMVKKARREWADAHGGAQIALANVMKSFGIPITESIEWRKTLIHPEDFLKPDAALVAALTELSQNYKLIAVTNNPVKTGRKNLEALGISDLFPNLVGLETCGVSKPAQEPFLKAVELLGTQPELCVSVGDRYDIDIAPALALGMGGILVNGPDDLLNLLHTK